MLCPDPLSSRLALRRSYSRRAEAPATPLSGAVGSGWTAGPGAASAATTAIGHSTHRTLLEHARSCLPVARAARSRRDDTCRRSGATSAGRSLSRPAPCTPLPIRSIDRSEPTRCEERNRKSAPVADRPGVNESLDRVDLDPQSRTSRRCWRAARRSRRKRHSGDSRHRSDAAVMGPVTGERQCGGVGLGHARNGRIARLLVT